MQTCWWRHSEHRSEHRSVHLTSPHLPGFMWYGGLKVHWSCLRYEYLPNMRRLVIWSFLKTENSRSRENWLANQIPKRTIPTCANIVSISFCQIYCQIVGLLYKWRFFHSQLFTYSCCSRPIRFVTLQQRDMNLEDPKDLARSSRPFWIMSNKWKGIWSHRKKNRRKHDHNCS